MTREQVDKIMLTGNPQGTELIETHISWVILGDRFVFKIKKPIRYSFLDFSTPEQRRYYCEREIQLNSRFTNDMYLDVQPVQETDGQFFIGPGSGEVIDYAVRMRKFDRNRQMDILLLDDKVTFDNIQRLAQKIADFHGTATVIDQKDTNSIRTEFNDLKNEKEYLDEYLSPSTNMIIDQAVDTSDRFIEENMSLLKDRLHEGFFRDCHGDLHSRNILLMREPQPFDCIEFNDDFRAIDVLNEVAFLCMDLDAFGKRDLSDFFLNCYNDFFPAVRNTDDYRLFIYYKMYRANVRAKVNSLRARSTANDDMRKQHLAEAKKYLALMRDYRETLDKKNLTWKPAGKNANGSAES